MKTGQLEKDRCEAILLKHGGENMVVDMVMQLAASEDGKPQELCVDIRDISERKKAELALLELAHKDELTGLFNRKSFLEIGKSVNELINKADQAMYEIKNSGKNNFAFAQVGVPLAYLYDFICFGVDLCQGNRLIKLYSES